MPEEAIEDFGRKLCFYAELGRQDEKGNEFPFDTHLAGQESDFALVLVFFEVGKLVNNRWTWGALNFDID